MRSSMSLSAIMKLGSVGSPEARCRPGSCAARRSGGARRPFPGRHGRVPCFLLGPLRVAARRVLGRQPVAGRRQRVLLAFCNALLASLVPSRLTVPSNTMPSAANSRSTWLNSPPSAVSWRARNRARWSHDPDAARQRSPGNRRCARTAVRSPGRTAHLGSTRKATRQPSCPDQTPPGRAHQPGAGGGTRPGPGLPPRPRPRTPDRPRAATHACPPASASADHAAGRGNSAA